MRDEDRRRLEQERDYPDGEAAVRHLEDALGLSLQSVHRLAAELASDLDPNRLGIGWWSPHLDDKRRILIGDYLVQSSRSIATNQANAAIHFLEYLDALEKVERRVAHAALATGRFQYPKPKSPRDILPEQLVDLHIAGFFRALGSTLDCLAAVVVGVLGIPVRIITADFLNLRRWFQGTVKKTTPRHQLQHEFGAWLESTISEAGPLGWCEWVDSYRNMLVHRARRLSLTMFDQETHLFDARGNPVPRLVSTPVLPKDPSKSDIEAMIEDTIPVLKEDARKTARGAFTSIRYLVDQCAKSLLEIWMKRRGDPRLISQPAAEWPDIQLPRLNPFSGYESKKLEFNVQALMTDPSAPTRLQAAALSNDERALWSDRPSG